MGTGPNIQFSENAFDLRVYGVYGAKVRLSNCPITEALRDHSQDVELGG